MASVVVLSGVTVRRGTTLLLDDVSLTVDERDRWVILGPNGAGKTTLLLIVAGLLFPTSGDVELLGEVPGTVSMADLRTRIGWASSAMIGSFPAGESVRNVVMTGAHAITGRWREEYDDSDQRRAEALLADWGMQELADRTFGTLSEGERKRALIARSLMADPELLLLDEPGAGLDLGGREDLVTRMQRFAEDPFAPAQLVVTHHVEEIPAGFTHGLLLRAGRVVAAGPLPTVVTSVKLSEAFATPLVVGNDGGRWQARRTGSS